METSFFERIKGYKTVTVNAIIMVMALLQALGILDIVPSASDIEGSADNLVGGLAAVYAGVNIWLRWLTTSGIFKSD